ncbi:metallopeptidase family protein [Sandaracinus amylolyticus]|uniref:Uncharacterized protein n=1 Tax=Sandaracinus amylolyticus TaxID=927083 RepID=A0A0F6SF85_9BACT|nr:metallopeptidase family protein [Sandaracinus amylolyticus]AKF06504.1 hypothetical protein DB32_003653 [Sandaracinus amylolyticus]
MRRRRVVLPSGLEVHVRAPEGAVRDDDVVDGTRLRFGRAIATLLAPGVVEGADVLALAMRDFHVLRDLLLRTGAIAPEPDDDARCRNCDAPLAFDPRELDPIELETAHASAPSPSLDPAPLPSPVRLPRGGIANEITMRPVTLREARPLLEALARDTPYRVTPRLLTAMGVLALGTLDRPVLMARVLGRASDAVWASVEQRYLELNAAPPLVAPLACPACGTLHEVVVPTPDELDPDATRTERDTGAPFLSEHEFERLVERLAPAIYEARGVRIEAVPPRVEPGVPATDIAGEPLLGSYEPRQEVDAAGYTQLEFVVTLYYRTFRRVWEDEGSYDVEAEIRETLDHELEHHLHHLAGHDPMDAAERAEARQELRALYGDRRLAKLAAREAARDLGQFVRVTWPFFVLIALALGAAAGFGWIRW